MGMAPTGAAELILKRNGSTHLAGDSPGKVLVPRLCLEKAGVVAGSCMGAAPGGWA